jgi:ABC-2 type transport system permease protein
MFIEIARFEFRYLLRNPLLWATAAFTFGLLFIATTAGGFELGSEGGLFENASYALLRDYINLSMIFMFATTSFVANVIIRDDETNFGPIVRSTQITKFQYLGGRFCGSFAAAALCMLAMPLAVWIGSAMPFADAATLGPNRVADHLYGYFLIALPNVLFHSALFFALATITRSMMAMYLGVMALVIAFFNMQGSFADQPTLQKIAPLLDPFGARALSNAARFWTIAERNVMLPEFAGMLLYNRLIWLAIAAIFLAVAYARFRFADEGMSKRERKRQKLMEGVNTQAGETTGPIAGATRSLPSPRFGSAASRAVLWLRTKFEIKQVLLHWAFPVLMAFGLYTTFFALTTQRDPDGRPTYPTTLSLIPEIAEAFQVVPLLIALYYVGELVWRERDRRVHEIVDASPIPNWAYVVPKTMAITIVLMAALLTTVVAAIIVQLSLGYTHLEPGKYLLWYVLPTTWDLVLLAAMAIFIQSLSPHKAVGWGVMILFYVLLEMPELKGLIEHNLLRYGNSPSVLLTDFNGAGASWRAAWIFRLYWGAFALLLLVGAHLLWRRGTEIRLRPRIANAWRRLAGAAGWVAAATLIAFIGTGAYAYYNTNVLNQYQTAAEVGERAAELERRYAKYLDMAQPLVVGMTLDVALYPEERRAVTKGRYRLRNETAQAIPEIHLRVLDDDLELTSTTVEGGRLALDDPQFRYRIYRLDRPMQPGEERLLSCDTRYWPRGFRHSQQNVKLVENGTLLSDSQLMPSVGMSYDGLMLESAKRRKYGLNGEIVLPKLEDAAATVKPNGARGWATTDITVSTTANQTPLSAGDKVWDVTRGGRRAARFVSRPPVRSGFSVMSATYAEKHRKHAGVDLFVYYHPAHAWNVDRMLDAMATSLDYYQANFGPYQFDHARIVELPRYWKGAQALAGTMPYSENAGFHSDYSGRETMDFVGGMTAHEVAHQWWAHQVANAEMEGALVLNETLAQYSAQMVIRKTRGADQVRRYLLDELDDYLVGRAVDSNDERPLARVLGQSYIAYQKGALVMYLLQERLGEAAVNRALRSVVQHYKFKGAPYPRSLDVVAALRAEAKTTEDQNLITDLWERITFYDLRVVEPVAVQRADGKWDVTVPVEARKMYADGQGNTTETPLSERIEVGLFTEKPGRAAFDRNDIVLMERQPIKSGKQVLKFVTAVRPLYAGIDPYNFYIDRKSHDNLGLVH